MKVYIIGIGAGSEDMLTKRAADIIKKVPVIIGAKRMTDIAPCGKTVFVSYNADQIREYLMQSNAESAGILLSGDIGFYSGAKKYIDALSDFDLELIPGISSVACFFAKLGMPWEDAKLLSLHGQTQNIIQYIKYNKKVFALLGGSDDIKSLCQKLCMYNMGYVTLHIGQRLSYADEKIISKKAQDICDFDFDSLCVLIAENPKTSSIYSLPDDDFIRGGVPMTKSEVRTISIAKLCLEHDSVLYDIGAGTGSVCVEASLRMTDGKVYAVERNADAVELIKQNKIKFAADNVSIVFGTAPGALQNLPNPTHAFIGGSGGSMEDIIELLLQKNPKVQIVINAITINTLCDVLKIINDRNLDAEIINVNVSKSKNAGGYHMMMAQNPVYIITIKG